MRSGINRNRRVAHERIREALAALSRAVAEPAAESIQESNPEGKRERHVIAVTEPLPDVLLAPVDIEDCSFR